MNRKGLFSPAVVLPDTVNDFFQLGCSPAHLFTLLKFSLEFNPTAIWTTQPNRRIPAKYLLVNVRHPWLLANVWAWRPIRLNENKPLDTDQKAKDTAWANAGAEIGDGKKPLTVGYCIQYTLPQSPPTVPESQNEARLLQKH